ncbi:MAG TPA: transcriptional repressor [Thermoanaerobaculia bacterium]|nr:transcriptional repressor [Thermoanaerobaculia bacterium]
MSLKKPALDREVLRFQKYLQQQHLKLTGEREAVVREIFATHYHFDADELLFKLKEKSAKISRATIYRTLELLVKSGMVRRVHLGEDHYHYERVTKDDVHHDHLICTTCGTVIEFHDESLEARQVEICERHRFISTFHNLQILGICASCHRRGEEPDSPDRVKMIQAGLAMRK